MSAPDVAPRADDHDRDGPLGALGGLVQPADATLVDLAVKWLRACVERDDVFVAENSLDQPPGLFTCIATAGPSFGLQAFADHLRGLKKAGWAGLQPTGYVVGDTAWFTGVEEGLLPWGEPLTIRITLVLVRSMKTWKVVHCHVSESVAREGIDLAS